MTGFALKMIALASMIIDHAGKILYSGSALSVTFKGVTYISDLLECIGRIAFPVYAFLVAEGCRKTRSMPKYIGRLALFSLISEAFYYAAFHRFGNVFTTLALGAAAAYARRISEPRWLSAPVLVLCMAAASYLHADYGGFGVVLIFLLYIMPSGRLQTAVLFAWSIGFYLVYALSLPMGLFASLSAVLVYLYNGERGRSVKWAFYIAYPAHLLIFAVIRQLFFIS